VRHGGLEAPRERRQPRLAFSSRRGPSRAIRRATLERQHVDDEGSRRGAGGRVPLGDQLVVGREDRVARHLELLRELARRCEPRARPQAAGENRLAQRAIGLPVERAVAIEPEEHAATGTIESRHDRFTLPSGPAV